MTGKLSTGWPKSVINLRKGVKSREAVRLERAKFVDPRSVSEIRQINEARRALGYSASMEDILKWIEWRKKLKKKKA